MINIQWLSPLDPEKTEIARYTQAILPSLHELSSVGVVTDARDTHKTFEDEKHVVGMEPMNIYNIGNSHLHCSILHFALREAGVVILHDVSLLELGMAYARENDDFSLHDMIVNEYGVHAVKAFERMYGGSAYEWRGESQQDYDRFVTSYPLFQSFISNARGIVVHSEFALKRVQEKYRGPVIKLELPYATPVLDSITRQHTEPCQIVFCGHAGPNRRLRQFIEAWAEVSRPNFFRLSLYGAIDKADEILSLAEDLGLAGLIKVVGFVAEEELDDALAAAHLALNLRNPTMGETSASQLRYWSKAIPSIVSDVGWYSELPHNVVIKVSPDREKQDIISILEKFVMGEPSYYETGANGYKYLCEKHSIERYVARLLEYVAQIENNRFIASVFDERLIDVMGSMCEDVDDSVLFEHTIKKLSATFDGIEKIQLNN
jgi:glycosyltransferase involved in cell wall biosynthesis